MTAPPIVVFAYRRPDHLARCLSSLAANDGAAAHPLIVYCDGAREAAHADGVENTRKVAAQANGFASVEIIARTENLGLARSIITGVTDVLASHDRIIVVEDDLILSPHFLAYMRDGLDLYADEPRVASIVGYSYPVTAALPETFFLRGTDCLGWATWTRAWATFEQDGEALLKELSKKSLRRAFDLDGAYPYTRLLKQQNRGGVSSWAVRWHASAYVKGMVSLFPRQSLVLHGGDDALATTSAETGWLNGPVAQTRVRMEPNAVEESTVGRSALVDFFRTNKGSFLDRAAGWARRKVRAMGMRR